MGKGNEQGLVTLVRQAIFTVLDEASPRTPGLAWDFNDDEQRVDFADRVASFIPSAKGTFETPESPQGEEAQVAGQATNGASGDNPGRCGSVRTLADSKGSTCRQSESAAPDESNRHCQYAQDVGMPEYRCAVECQYMQSATLSRDAIIEECAKVCDRWAAFTRDERGGKRGEPEMLADDIRALKGNATDSCNSR